MTPTEFKLTAVYKGPTVPLSDICKPYLNLSYAEARRRAALNQLPFPTFRLGNTSKAPVVVSVRTLAEHIDAREASAQAEWRKSQV